MGHIKNQLSEILGARRMHISALAEGANLAYNTAHALYHGSSKRIDLDTLARICQLLDIQPGDIFVYVEEDEEKPA